MKTKVFICIILLISLTVMARVIGVFPGWDRLIKKSKCIFVAHCGKPYVYPPNVAVMDAPKSDFKVQVISVLKGEGGPASSHLETDRVLQEGNDYLVFGIYNGQYYPGGAYQAFEEFNVIPLGENFSTNAIAGRPMDEQIKILLQMRLNDLNQQIPKELEEKEHLEEALKK